jgi:putative ABC transport system permease protein
MYCNSTPTIIELAMQSLLRNLRFGVRTLSKSPAFVVAAILTIALGIGANTAIFTVTNALLLRPFPFHDPAQLVTIGAKEKTADYVSTLMRYELVRDQNRSFQQIAAWTSDNLNLTGAGEPVQAPIMRVSPSFFTLLGVTPTLGRVFTEQEGRPESEPVAILSNAAWRDRFHSDAGIVGRTVSLDSTLYTIVGVLPADARFPFVGPADIWTPRYFEYSLMTPQRLRLGVGYLGMIARLRTGVTIQQANTELDQLNSRYRAQYSTMPDAGAGTNMAARDLRDLVVGDMRGKVWMLSGAVAIVLLIACANVASLLLSRALSRRKEIAVRTALGASRAKIVYQLLTESMILALIAGMLGAGLGWAAVRALVTWGASQLPQGIAVTVDTSVLLFTLGLSIVTGLAFGTFPALQLARVEPNTTLRDEGHGASIGRSRARTQNLLVVGQVALSLVLLIGASLLLRSFAELVRVNPGFDAENVLTLNLSLSTVKYASPDRQIAFFDEVLRRVSTIPGVRSVASSATLPLTFKRMGPVLVEGQPVVALAQRPFVDVEAVSPGWFDTMRVPLRSGRQFGTADNARGPKVVIVNETFARRFWPNESALDKHMLIGRWTEPATVVAVSADIKNKGLEQETQAQLYIPFPQLPWGDMNLLVRTAVPPQTITSSIRAAIHQVDAEQPLTKVQTVNDLMDSSRAQPRLLMMMVGTFSATALALAVIGIYGVLSYSVAKRKQEFGIRLALGAGRGDILRLVLRQGFVLTVAGIAVGLVAAFVLAGLASSVLYKVGAHDPVVFICAPLVFLGIALLACYLPACRAFRADPLEALKQS